MWGLSDCEAITGGFLGQPANAVSSLAMVVAALVVVLGSSPRHRSTALALAGALAFAGLGSFLFHGPMPDSAGLVHDAGIAWLLLSMAVLRAGATRTRSTMAAIAAIPLGALGGNAALVAGGGLLVATEATRRDHPRSAWWRAAIAAGALGGIALVAGRTGGPLCDPAAAFQFHAVWHVAVAVAGYCYARDLTMAS